MTGFVEVVDVVGERPSFDRHAATYEASAAVQAWLAEWLETWVEPEWPREAAVIEIGAGTGLLTRRLVRRGSVIALDRSGAMVAQGCRRVPDACWRRGDALDLTPARWDRIYSSAVLQWMGDVESGLRSLGSALRPGGRMLHALFVSPTLPELGMLAREASPLAWRRAEDWLEDASRAGLRVLRWEKRQVESRHPDALAFLRTLHDTGVTPAVPKLGPGRLRSVLRRYDELCRAEGGGVRATWTALRFEAERTG